MTIKNTKDKSNELQCNYQQYFVDNFNFDNSDSLNFNFANKNYDYLRTRQMEDRSKNLIFVN